ncbi:excalibur calcium-binding domain-containing protein [Marinobacter santoriniensis]|nr:excalibur calcium-binding domain-containing protein [Marinobacter santoriniensis]
MTLKKLLIIALLAVGGWQLYQRHGGQIPELSFSPTESSSQPSRFKCDGRQYCSQMTSREEAVFFTRHCPNTKMDGDHDGIPCENDSRF